MPRSRWLLLALLTWLPWLELRGSIPLGLAWGMPWLPVALVALTANALLFWPVWAAMALLYERWLRRYLTQMAGLAVQNFVSAATGLAVAVAVIRGLVRRESASVGNFWVDSASCCGPSGARVTKAKATSCGST